MSAESGFRSQLSSFGWSRAEPPPVSTSQGSFFDRLNPFNANGYVRLPTTSGDLPPQMPAQSRGEEEALFNLSRWDRMIVFAMLVVGSAACFFIAFFFLPILALRPRKFVTLWTVGSLLFISSFAALQGPLPYAKHLLSGPRLPFTAAYFGSMGLTLYFSLGLNNTILTILSAAVQMVALLWYLLSYFP
jgi:hypothetical protein